VSHDYERDVTIGLYCRAQHSKRRAIGLVHQPHRASEGA
jgi:hypothetical protein